MKISRTRQCSVIGLASGLLAFSASAQTALLDQIVNDGNSAPLVSFSLVEGTLPFGTSDGGGNIFGDPLFVDAWGPDGVAGTPDDDLRLQQGSPAIDAGDVAALPLDVDDLDGDGNLTEPIPIDIRNGVRVHDGGGGVALVDLGAYEYGAPVVIVDRDDQAPTAERYVLQVYPNPSRSRPTIEFALPEADAVRVAVYDVLGRLVQTVFQGKSEPNRLYRVHLNDTVAPSGLYFVQLTSRRFAANRSITLLR